MSKVAVFCVSLPGVDFFLLHLCINFLVSYLLFASNLSDISIFLSDSTVMIHVSHAYTACCLTCLSSILIAWSVGWLIYCSVIFQAPSNLLVLLLFEQNFFLAVTAIRHSAAKICKSLFSILQSQISALIKSPSIRRLKTQATKAAVVVIACPFALRGLGATCVVPTHGDGSDK